MFWLEARENETEHTQLLDRLAGSPQSTPALTSEEAEFIRARSAETQAFVGNVLFGAGVATMLAAAAIESPKWTDGSRSVLGGGGGGSVIAGW